MMGSRRKTARWRWLLGVYVWVVRRNAKVHAYACVNVNVEEEQPKTNSPAASSLRPSAAGSARAQGSVKSRVSTTVDILFWEAFRLQKSGGIC